MPTETELPLWQSHKRVHAAPIETVEGATMVLRISKSLTRTVVAAPGMFARYTPEPGDFYVVYDQGEPTEYVSISPKAAFEAGYFRLYGSDRA